MSPPREEIDTALTMSNTYEEQLQQQQHANNNNIILEEEEMVVTTEMGELFEDFMQHGNLGLHIVDKNGIILWANQAELDLLGYTKEEYIGKSIREFHASQEKIDYILSVLLSGGKLSNYRAPIKCKDGHIEYMDITSSMRKVNGDCTTTRCFSVCVTNKASSQTAGDLVSSEEGSLGKKDNQHNDNTNKTAGGETSRENKDTNNNTDDDTTNGGHSQSEKEELAVLFEDFMEFGTVGLHIVDSTGIIRWANKAEMDLLGYTREEYFGKSVTEVYADADVLQQLLTTLLSGKKLIRAVTPLWAKDGHVEYVEINSSMRKVNGKCSTTRCFSTCVTDRVLREREEAKARAKEIEAAASREETRRKTDFLRKLCHELRNPLAGVTGNIQLLLSELHHAQQEDLIPTQPPIPIPSTLTTEEKLAETEKRLAEAESKLSSMKQLITTVLDYAESAQLAAEHQMLVVNDTLSLSRLESEGSEFSMKPVDICNILDSVKAILGVKAQEKSIDFTITAKDALPVRARYVRTDPVWLKQILINLVSNALKFTSEQNGRVDLVVGVQEQPPNKKTDELQNKKQIQYKKKYQEEQEVEKVTLMFSVTDNGIGMTKEEQGRLFGVFAQANERISSQFGGSGLGLYIVKQLLEHVGGTVKVVSQKDQGSSFIITMPCEVLTNEERTKLINKPKTPLLQGLSKERKPSIENKNIRVLVVDDSTVNRRMLASFLKKQGYSYETAENGLVALNMYEQATPTFDVILTDVDMPVMDGNELTRIIRRKESEVLLSSSTSSTVSDDSYDSIPIGGVPIIGISGNALPDDISAAKKDGMNAYISKPFNFQELESLILMYATKEYQQ